jgi:hypothetical protein
MRKGSVDLINGEVLYGDMEIWFGEQIRVRLENGTTRVAAWSAVKECCYFEPLGVPTPPVIPIEQGERSKTQAPSPASATQTQPTQGDNSMQLTPASDGSPYVSAVGKQPSPRQAFFVGLGLGGGRLQDTVTGYGGVAFNLDAGYSISPELAVVVDFDGIVHQHGEGGDSKDDADKREAARLWHYGVAVGAQLHVIERLRLALGVGYYALTHTAAKDAAGDSIGESRTLKSLGAEGTVGFEFFQSPGGFSAGVDFRTQLAFPDQKLVAATFGLVGVRWYGIGAKRG